MPSLVIFLQTFIPLLLFSVCPFVLDYFGLKVMTNQNYRPRSSLTRYLLAKMNSESEARLLMDDNWYNLNIAMIKDREVNTKFVKLSADDETIRFIKTSTEKSEELFTQIYHNFAKVVLSWFYSQTDINGILQRGSMFVLSREQFLLLTDAMEEDSMIDLGAGDGATTLSMAPSFNKVYATEASKPMRAILEMKSIKVLMIEDWINHGPYNLISCLNLLDRAENPLAILQDVKLALKPKGLFLVALVLPYTPYVETNQSHKPTEPLDITGQTLEDQIVSAIKIVESAGFQLLKWTRVPYLCEGDLNQPIYHLADFVMIFKHK